MNVFNFRMALLNRGSIWFTSNGNYLLVSSTDLCYKPMDINIAAYDLLIVIAFPVFFEKNNLQMFGRISRMR